MEIHPAILQGLLVFSTADEGAHMAKIIGTFFQLFAAKALGMREHNRMLQKTCFYLQLITSYCIYLSVCFG